jgi:hypothetical protein
MELNRQRRPNKSERSGRERERERDREIEREKERRSKRDKERRSKRDKERQRATKRLREERGRPLIVQCIATRMQRKASENRGKQDRGNRRWRVCSKNEFSKKYQYSKIEFSKKYQYRKNEFSTKYQ